MRLAALVAFGLLLMAAWEGAASASPPAELNSHHQLPATAAASPPPRLFALARAVLDPPSLSTQRVAPDSSALPSNFTLYAFCALLADETPDLCGAGSARDAPTVAFARALCPECNCASGAATAGHRHLTQAVPADPAVPCSQAVDAGAMCKFFLQSAPGACSDSGFAVLYVRTLCAKSCHICTQDSSAPVLPSPSPSPTPTCAMEPDTGTACQFFFDTLANPCTAQDSFIQLYVR
eukprot:scaffold28.g7580.t1